MTKLRRRLRSPGTGSCCWNRCAKREDPGVARRVAAAEPFDHLGVAVGLAGLEVGKLEGQHDGLDLVLGVDGGLQVVAVEVRGEVADGDLDVRVHVGAGGIGPEDAVRGGQRQRQEKKEGEITDAFHDGV